jgi:hypothetical protein
MCFAAMGRLQGWAAKLLLVGWQSPGILRVRCKFALQLTFGGMFCLRTPTLGGDGVVFAIEAYLKISF